MNIYAFILGRVYTLSLAEIFAYIENSGLPFKIIDASAEVLIIQSTGPIDHEKIMRSLGGIVRIIKIVSIHDKRDTDTPYFILSNYFKPSVLKNDFLKGGNGKLQVGVSCYLMHPQIKAYDQPKRIGMLIKKVLQDSGKSIRIVLPQNNLLSLASVQVANNLLLEKGAEINIVIGVDKVYVGRTLIVQNFEDYGRRDYQRPIRDMVVGMIPPKVAQSMINLAGLPSPLSVAYDPFCGLGTIIQEAVLMGYKAIGSDIEIHQIVSAEKNLEWFKNRYKVPNGRYHVQHHDARDCATLVDKFKAMNAIKKVDAVVTECTLGPMYGSFPPENEISANHKMLCGLYKDFLSEAAKFLEKGAKVVMCMPAYKKGRDNYRLLESLDWASEIGYNIKEVISSVIAKKFKFLKLTERKTVVYDRKDQVVAREIVIFEKN